MAQTQHFIRQLVLLCTAWLVLVGLDGHVTGVMRAQDQATPSLTPQPAQLLTPIPTEPASWRALRSPRLPQHLSLTAHSPGAGGLLAQQDAPADCSNLLTAEQDLPTWVLSSTSIVRTGNGWLDRSYVRLIWCGRGTGDPDAHASLVRPDGQTITMEKTDSTDFVYHFSYADPSGEYMVNLVSSSGSLTRSIHLTTIDYRIIDAPGLRLKIPGSYEPELLFRAGEWIEIEYYNFPPNEVVEVGLYEAVQHQGDTGNLINVWHFQADEFGQYTELLEIPPNTPSDEYFIYAVSIQPLAPLSEGWRFEPDAVIRPSLQHFVVQGSAATSYNSETSGASDLTLDAETPTPTPMLSPAPCGGSIDYEESIEDHIAERGGSCTYSFAGSAGYLVTISMSSNSADLDPYLELRDENDNLVASDDDSGGDKDSLISNHSLSLTGRYIIVAKTYQDESSGNFVLSLNSSAAATVHDLWFRNDCDRPIQLALTYLQPSNLWLTDGWWNLAAGSGLYLTNSYNERVSSSEPTFYFYARTTDGSNLEWAGDYPRDFQGVSLSMRSLTLSLDSDDDYVLSISCN